MRGILLVLAAFITSDSFTWMSAQAQSITPPGADARTRQTIDEVVSVFENGTTVLQYDYVEALGDGRGYTAGRAGFTTGTGDLVEVLKLYLRHNTNAGFTKLIPILDLYALMHSGSLAGLETLPALWAQAALLPAFRDAQDEITNQFYFNPAMAMFSRMKLKTSLGRLCIYDAFIEQGEEGPDGVEEMVSHMDHALVTEKDRLLNFLDIRYAVLMNPKDPATAQTWRDSVYRVQALRDLVTEGAFDLVVPLIIDPWNSPVTIP